MIRSMPLTQTVTNTIAFCIALCFGFTVVEAENVARQSQRSIDRLDACLDKASYYSREQNRCFFVDSEEQARLTRRAYEAARGRAGSAQNKRLASAQNTWITATKRKCRSYRLYSPEVAGTDEISEIYSCLSLENVTRTDWLERQFRHSKPQD
jgi:uncharacterized protein YecT (DUF1311 family)